MRRALVALVTVAAAACGAKHARGPTQGCVGLACQQVDCGDQPPTTVTGTVMAPNGLDPIPGALVYVPSTVPEFTDGVSCDACMTSFTGAEPIVSTTTALDGSFTLTNVPVATQVPLVVQKGRFRRQVNLNIVACTNQALTVEQVRLPKKQSEGAMPKIAVGVGDYDQIECVLRAIGIDDAEFTPPTSTGAVHLYDNSGGTPSLESMLSDGNSLNRYNLLFVNCTAQTFDLYGNQSQVKSNLYSWVNAGGRLYVTDWAYDYMEQISQFAPYIFFDGGGDMTNPQPVKAADYIWSGAALPASIGQSDLASWMKAAGASSDGSVSLEGAWALSLSTGDQGRYPSTTWVHGVANGVDRPMTVTYNYGGCGKVLWSAYHTRQPGGGSPGLTSFPLYCKSTAQTMIAQEKILEYLIFEFSSCVGPVM